ncbi:MAG: hypothetical protein V3R57_06375 [Candidatus Bathyarchaeia archaeon]
MKLLKYPFKGDPILNRIEGLREHLSGEHGFSYIDEVLSLITDVFSTIPPGDYPGVDACEKKLFEARRWLWEDMEDEEPDSNIIPISDHKPLRKPGPGRD